MAIARIRIVIKTRNFSNTFFTTLQDPSTAQDFISAVEHCCLSRGYCSLGFDELDTRVVVLQWRDRLRCRRVTIAHAPFCLHGLTSIIDSYPVNASSSELVAQPFFIIANNHLV